MLSETSLFMTRTLHHLPCLLTLALSLVIFAHTTTSQAFKSSRLESPPIADKTSLIDFVRDCIDLRSTEFIVNYTHGFIGTNDDILYSCNLPHIYSKVIRNNGTTARVLYKITYYPGMRIADAHLKHDTSQLTNDEYRLYNIALSIIDQASGMSDLRAELFFHDTICKYVSYYTREASRGMPRHATALGAFLDRRANCQGYCDAFYMLCTMFGLKVDMQSGFTGKQRHVWNVIEIGKKWYAVDVTWDDNETTKNKGISFISHKYFNAPEEIMKATHSWEEENETESIEKKLDSAYFYLTDEVDDYTFGYFFTSIKEAIDFISLQLIKNKKSIRVMTLRGDKNYDDVKFVNFLINSSLSRARKGVSYYNISQRHGRYMFYAIEVKARSRP